ncbi:uncharacterized protein ACA1_362920 [Acanthamoeba castellanii str. Neff]|uniref:Carbonyl reductase n=1 Tax=Acanthamoeba castellanii (strain ATCC 30010 / Neff) TaxID=1257118 RepID=L8GG05_ACACF|nr:uncharacterized protein ACA1_362920 [Acanthamoeba castellanii str. Neff]ELR11804.1 hypothetical protein ACA1_362920 [Acanthamoeba castellanii str. Neff]
MATAAGQKAGHVALVTGAFQGIGFAIATQLARARPDFHVLVGSRDLARGEEAVAQLKADGVANVGVLHLDIDDIGFGNGINGGAQSSITTAADTVAKTYGGLDVLVNNAGMAFKGFNVDVARATLATHYYGPKNVTTYFLPLIRDYGRVVNVSSRAGLLSKLSSDALKQAFTREDLTREELDTLADKFVSDVAKDTFTAEGWPSTTYGVSKIAVNALTRIVAREEAKNTSRKGVLINACCPEADVAVYLALLPHDSHYNGLFFAKRQQIDY